MASIQYTIRSVPPEIDSFLRRQAMVQNKSLNQVVLDYIAQATKLDLQQDEVGFDWLVGANTMDAETLQAISEMKFNDKLKTAL